MNFLTNCLNVFKLQVQVIYYSFKGLFFSQNYNTGYTVCLGKERLKGGVGKFEKPARDTLFVIFHGILLTSR